jgi:hypothetical protein
MSNRYASRLLLSSFLSSRPNSRRSKNIRTGRGARRWLQLEALEERQLLAIMSQLVPFSGRVPIKSSQPVQRIGINFVAPGDRLADDGTMWHDFPSVGGRSPDIQIRVSAGKVQRWFRDHTAYVTPSSK